MKILDTINKWIEKAELILLIVILTVMILLSFLQVLLRNIFDVVVSTNDHFRNEDDRGPSVYIHPEFHRMSEDEKFDFLIANCLPWYFSFFASWRDAQKELFASK